MTAAGALRARLAAGPLLVPGVFDALSARLAGQAGFEAVFASGYAVAAARLAMPDLGYLTPPEMAGAVAPMAAAAGVPVIVDADTGYGNAMNARRTAADLARSGAAGIMIEDQVWPKSCGHLEGKAVVPRGEWLAKLRAVADLRADGVDLLLVARTDARSAVSLDEAVGRARDAHAAGADVVFVEAPRSREELAAVAEGTPGAVRMANMVEGGLTPLLTPAELGDLGFHLVASPLTALFAATRAMRDALATLLGEGTMRDHPHLGVGFREFGEVVGLTAHRALAARYAAGGPSTE